MRLQLTLVTRVWANVMVARLVLTPRINSSVRIILLWVIIEGKYTEAQKIG
jgi:hypothetical protein